MSEFFLKVLKQRAHFALLAFRLLIRSLFQSIVLIILFQGVPAGAQSVTVPDDVSYLTLDYGPFQIIYPAEHAQVLPELFQLIDPIFKTYEKEFDWVLDEKIPIVLVSNRAQIPDANVVGRPFMRTVYYPGGAPILSHLAESQWMKSLVVHESAHLYQVNVKKGWPSQIIHKYLRNVFFFPVLFLPVFVTPNELLPRLFMEGNATWNESRWGVGGRLHSGRERALVYTLAQDDLLTPARLINETIGFPFSNSKYALGGYFYNYLDETFPDLEVNQHMTENSYGYLNPIWLNKHFQGYFHANLRESLVSFAKSLKQKSKDQKSLSEAAIISSLSSPELTRDSKYIYGVIQDDYQSPPKILKVDRQTLQWTLEENDRPDGPVIQKNGKLFTSASARLSPALLKYALFESSTDYLEDSLGQYYFDQSENPENPVYVSIDIQKSFSQTILNVNGQQFGPVSSLPRVSAIGDLYYFDQQGSRRILKKNREELFSLESYDSEVVDVTDTWVYFSQASEKGIQIFGFELASQKVFKILDSDRALDMRVLKQDSKSTKALVTELSSAGYQMKLVEFSPGANPNDEFKSEKFYPPLKLKKPKFDLDPGPTSLQAAAPTVPPTVQPAMPQTSDYNYLSEMRWSQTYAGFGFGFENDFLLTLSPYFIDPMGFNALSLLYARGIFQSQYFGVNYLNSRNRLNWTISFLGYDTLEILKSDTKYSLLSKTSENKFQVGLLYPFWLNRRNIITGKVFSSVRSKYKDFINTDVELSYEFSKSYPLNIDSYRGYVFEIAGSRHKESTPSGVQQIWTYNWGWEVYSTVQNFYARSQISEIELFEYYLNQQSSLSQYSMDSSYALKVDRVFMNSLSIKKAIQLEYLCYKFPLSLRRVIPEIKYSFFDVTGSSRTVSGVDRFQELNLNLGVEFLILHSAPITFVMGGRNIYYGNSAAAFTETYAFLNYRKN